jgi:hypothetical protein
VCALGTARAVPERMGSTVCCFGRIGRCGSAQRGAKACGCNNPDTAVESPLVSVRGCGPKPPPCRPFLMAAGPRYFSGSKKFRLVGSTVRACTPQRTQRSRAKSTPMAAAESGSKVLETSIQAQTLPACVSCARNERANDVRPEHSGPTSSVTAPIGRPPRSTSSRASIPVAATGRTIFACGVRADGIFRASGFHLHSDCGGGDH